VLNLGVGISIINILLGRHVAMPDIGR